MNIECGYPISRTETYSKLMSKKISTILHLFYLYNSNSMFLSFFSEILIGLLVKLNGFYTSIKTCAYEYLISALISQC